MKVSPYRWPRDQKAHKGHSRPEVKKYAKCWAIEHNGKFFSYAYLEESYAQVVCERLNPEDKKSIAANFKEEPIFVTSRVQD